LQRIRSKNEDYKEICAGIVQINVSILIASI